MDHPNILPSMSTVMLLDGPYGLVSGFIENGATIVYFGNNPSSGRLTIVWVSTSCRFQQTFYLGGRILLKDSRIRAQKVS